MSVSDKLGLPEFIGFFTNAGWASALLIGWVITPVALILVAAVLESRSLLENKHPFRSFFPGDFFLGGILAASVKLAEGLPETNGRWYQSSLWHWLLVGGAIIGGLIARQVLDAPNYSSRQLWSPSKVYHDFALYIGYGGLLFAVGLPGLLYGAGIWVRIIQLGCLAIWVSLLIYDGMQPEWKMRRMIREAHPSYGWQYPVWRRR